MTARRCLASVLIVAIYVGGLQAFAQQTRGANPSSSQNILFVTKGPVPCYRDGPAQGRPPDRMVLQDTEVNWLGDTLEPYYVVVKLPDGMRCYIATDAVSLFKKSN